MLEWLKRRILRPVYDFLYRHLCWVEAQGQVFQAEGAVHIQWNENCSSVVTEAQCPKIFRRLRDVPHGSVVFCERIWMPGGFLGDIRAIQVILGRDEILMYRKNGTIEYKPFLRDGVAAYSRRLKLFDLVNPHRPSVNNTINNKKPIPRGH